MNVDGNPTAWALTAISGDKQWGGNTGYDDDPKRLYRYDSQVPNHRRLSEGDIVVIRDRTEVIGISIVQGVSAVDGQKVLRRCPVCRTAGIKRRRKIRPVWRCKNAHEFDEPDTEQSDVVLFEARYGERFVPINTQLSVKALKEAALRPNDQLSIEELDLLLVERMLVGLNGVTELLTDVAYSENVPQSGDRTADFDSLIQERREVMRSIAIRRGQTGFRKRLFAKYGARCMISGCKIVDLLEAAHIVPYALSFDNGGSNGLLFRSDLHTLFDLNKIAINPDDLKLNINIELQGTEYGGLSGQPLNCDLDTQPSQSALTWRWKRFSAS